MEVVVAVAGGIGAVGEEVVVVAVLERANGHERLADGHLVHVEDDFLRGGERAFFAAEDTVLLALFRALVEPVAALEVRRGFVGLFDATKHFRVEAALEGFEGGHDRRRVGVFGLEVVEDGGIFFFAQPEEGVLDFVAVEADGLRVLGGDRDGGGGGVEGKRRRGFGSGRKGGEH